jgi:hypothetical protein
MSNDIITINSASLNLSGKDALGNEIDTNHIYFFEKTKKYYVTTFDKSEWLFVSFFSIEEDFKGSGVGTGGPIINTGGGSFYTIEYIPEEFKITSSLDEITSAKDLG